MHRRNAACFAKNPTFSHTKQREKKNAPPRRKRLTKRAVAVIARPRQLAFSVELGGHTREGSTAESQRAKKETETT
jgi:hypothetical protein